MSKTRLGVDMGTNSIGWILFQLDEKGEIVEIRAAGVRIFASGRDLRADVSSNEARRKARQMRRRRDRYLQRRNALMTKLREFGLMPEEQNARRDLQDLSPYRLRARAVSGRIDLHHLGRAIFHIGQRRGFKSNRRTDKQTDGPVSESVDEFRKKIGGNTVGQFLASIHEKGEPVRARRHGTTKKDLYSYYPDRAMIEEEFNAVWKKQAEFHSEVLTEDKREILFDVIFHQRPLKSPIVGRCRFFPEEYRAPKALPSFQRFRILQDINHLRYYDENGEAQPLSPETRNDALQTLKGGGNLTFVQLNRKMKNRGEIGGDVAFNLQDEKRKEIKGSVPDKTMGKILSQKWSVFTLSKKDSLVSVLLDDAKSDDEAIAELRDKWELSEEEAKKCIQENLDGKTETAGRAALSAKAIAALMPYLEKGMRYDEAVAEAEERGRLPRSEHDGETLRRLPEYPKVLKEWCVPRTHEDEGNSDNWRIPNPTVHIAMNQLRHLVNDIIRKHGMPDGVVVELARDLPMGKKTKKELLDRQSENQKKREKWRKEIEDFGFRASSDSILRMQLWNEIGTANNRPCVYCGKQFGVRAVLSDECEVDHILPFSKTLDDGIGNKILCCRQCNREKGNHTPHETWGGNGERYAEILERAKKLPKSKHAKFLPDAMGKYDRGEGGFLARQLTDTQYIARAAKRYLECVIPRDVYVIPGRLTAILRRQWGLNNILGDGGEKTRRDHRHHAIDAAVVGATTRSVLQRMATQAERDDSTARLHSDAPAENFRAMVENAVRKIVVSHKPNRQREGQLHNETAYSLRGDVNESGPTKVMHRVFVNDLNLSKAKKIVSDHLRKELITVCESADGKKDMKSRLAEWGEKNGVRRVLLRDTLSVIAVRDREGKPYKAHKKDGNWAMEIYETAKGWGGEVISTFHANQKNYVPKWRQQSPLPPMVMRLHKNDMVAVDGKDGGREIYCVKEISGNNIVMVEHSDANPARHAKVLRKAPNELRKIGGRKIHISPAGFITDPRKNGG